MTARAAQPPPNRSVGGHHLPVQLSPLARRLAPAGIALPVLILAATLFAVAADTNASGARALWIPAAIGSIIGAGIAWTDILIVVHRRRPSGRSLPPAGDRPRSTDG
ncbi:hypothetical protein B4N89_33720 [Embleya scabrispora]|uniref:Uncharacterized protein n=1 Tax=Embleya scabrispora TaxID=159449 RepID=A0A1T3NQS0_9ACTN|nr:hypothetical protein [Embleya scabrispora]OPC79060.1 hypothetical protein B4N89_33720 [Embleya scabrispora]